jgi:hypothetical protein
MQQAEYTGAVLYPISYYLCNVESPHSNSSHEQNVRAGIHFSLLLCVKYFLWPCFIWGPLNHSWTVLNFQGSIHLFHSWGRNYKILSWSFENKSYFISSGRVWPNWPPYKMRFQICMALSLKMTVWDVVLFDRLPHYTVLHPRRP